MFMIIGRFQKISIPIPRAASWNSEGERGFLDWNSEGIGGGGGGVTQLGIPKAWGGFSSRFPEGGDDKSFA